MKVGLDAALKALPEAHTPPPGGPAGADRLAGAVAPDGGRQLSLLDAETGDAIAGEGREGPGRRPGVPNKRTGQLAAWLSARGFRHPAETLAELQNYEPKQLAKELGCKRIEAAHLIASAAEKLMPYVASKMPVALDLGGEDDERPMILIGAMRAPSRAAAGGTMGLDDPADESEEIPGFAGDESV